MNPIGLASGVVPELSPPETVAAAAAGGFDGVGLWVEPAQWTAETTRAVCDRVADAGLKVIDVEVIWIKPGPLDPDHLRILDVGGAVGAAHALVVSSDPDHGATAAKFAALCEHAAPLGIGVALEFGLFTDVKTIHQASSILQRVLHPAARLLVDTLHLDRSDGSATDVAMVPREWLTYAQLCDASASRPAPDDVQAIIHEAVYGRLLPGEGALDLDAVLDALPVGLPLSIELRSQALYDAWPDGKERAVALAQATRSFLAARTGVRLATAG